MLAMKIFTPLVLSLFCLSPVIASDPGTISVSGLGSVSAEPDEGYINLGVTNKNDSSAQAVLDNTKSMNELFKALEELGIEKKDIKTVQFSVNQMYRQVEITNDQNRKERTSVPNGFQVSNLVQIKVRELDDMGKVLDLVTQRGANRINGISFGSSEASKYLDEARVKAVKNAVKKAELLLSPLDRVKLGRILSISESQGRAPGGYARFAVSMHEESSVPVSGGSLDFTVNVSIGWELDQGAVFDFDEIRGKIRNELQDFDDQK